MTRETPSRRQRAWLAAWLLALLAPALAQVPDPAATTRTVGAATLTRCEDVDAWCGRLARPLDATGKVAGAIEIAFEYYPARGAGPRRGTLVATEGGPGYPATGSREAYLALYEPLRGDHDVVLMDNRGTGRSGAIHCEPLQNATALTLEDIGRCGATLGARAALYGTADAADDLEAVLAALDAGPVDLYGDSYGTFFAQVFAVRHPGRLRSLVLDGAYPLDGPDLAWYPGYAPAMRDKFNRLCERNPSCAALPGSSLEHLAPALAALRRQPHPAVATDADGTVQHFRADAGALATVLFGAAPAYATLKEADAAARAYVAGDRRPLHRLMAESLAAVDSRDATRAPALFSAGLAAAVMCEDAPQIFDMHLPPAARLAARDRALAGRRRTAPDTYAPFTIDEYRRMPPDYAFIEQCVRWPAADPAHPPAYREGAVRGFAAVPVLVLSGELDNMTTVADGAAAAAQFPQARQVVLANSLHVNALPHARSPCGAALVRRFIETLDVGDTTCAAAIPPLRLAPAFVRRSDAVTPAIAQEGNGADARDLRLAAAALATVGDLLGRLAANGSGHGEGLRGGTFTASGSGVPAAVHAELHAVRWTEDLAVSGTVDFRPGADDGEAVLSFRAADGRRGELRAAWPPGGPEARARLDGRIDGRPLRAQAPAP
jgi:pimeloyl-ACP methyl ester carboxylesterase